ncbi:MAG: Na/Pi symporter [Caldilineaceae bacterium]|nr:Na/Pi symporter [Caldilineaceae bacterium]
MTPGLLSILPALLGGIGLFLVGMMLMSEGLKAAAGETLQNVLQRFTRTPITAFLSGISLTALVQSSSATTITTIGFVSAGLLSFTAAIGVIIGANVGTTSTGWIVSLLGFKMNIGAISLPIIGIGAFLRLLSHGRRAELGTALVGFGLIFMGIDALQDGMGGLAQNIDLSAFSGTSLGGRVALVMVGFVMTVLLQSSSVAVALTLTALHGGAIGLQQSAFLVIGQSLGTTVTAVIAAMGASVPAQRTALAHVLFNAITGFVVFWAVSPILDLIGQASNGLGNGDPAVQIAIFHTIFKLIGTLIFLPFVQPFARLIIRLIPTRGPILTRHLDRSVLGIPAVAVETAARAMKEITAVTVAEALHLLDSGALDRSRRERLWAAQAALQETATFLSNIQMQSSVDRVYYRRLSLLHAGDHLSRLTEACLESESPIQGSEVEEAAQDVMRELEETLDWLRQETSAGEDLVHHLADMSARQANRRRKHRAELLEDTASNLLPPEEAQRRLESMRWVDRVTYHTWRALYHLSTTPEGSASESSVYPEAEQELTTQKP